MSTLIAAVTSGNAQLLKELLKDASQEEATDALVEAAEKGRTTCLELLLDKGDPQVDNCLPLCAAALFNHTDCVRLLLPVSDQSGIQHSVRLAASEDNQSMFDVVYPYVHKEALFQSIHGDKRWQLMDKIDQFIAQYEATQMTAAVSGFGVHKQGRKL